MNKHFIVLLAGSSLFVVMFLWQTAPMRAANFEGARMVYMHTKQRAMRTVVPYGAFLVVLFGHRHLTRREDEK